MTDTKLRPEDLTSEERAIVLPCALNYWNNEYSADESWRSAFAQMEPLILARRALFAPAPEKAAKVEKFLPCGCVLCTCEDEIQCQGCGAKLCGNHRKTMMAEPAPPEPAAPEMPEAVTLDGFLTDALEVADVEGMSDDTVIPTWPADIADMGRKLTVGSLRRLSNWWRTHAQPVAVRMSGALERVLQCAEMDANVDRMRGHELSAENTMGAIRAVRQQAAQPVRMEKVRAGIELLISKCDPRCNMNVRHYEAMLREMLAELDAYEGEGEGRG